MTEQQARHLYDEELDAFRERYERDRERKHAPFAEGQQWEPPAGSGNCCLLMLADLVQPG